MDLLFKTCRAQAAVMLAEYQAIKETKTSSEQLDLQTSAEPTLLDCGNSILIILIRQASIISKNNGDIDLLQRRLDDLISIANDKFYCFPFKDVPPCWRMLYTDASILKACSLILSKEWEMDGDSLNNQKNYDWIDELVKTLDMAVIMAGAPGPGRTEWISNILSLLLQICPNLPVPNLQEHPSQKRRKLNNDVSTDSFPDTQSFLPPVSNPIKRKSQISLSTFEKYMHLPCDESLGPEPLIIENAISHFPALNERPWKRPSYLLSQTLGGRRLVPIEIGRTYVDSDWAQKIIPFKEFLEKYIYVSETRSHDTPESASLPSSAETPETTSREKKIGYLAQHPLFTQIPSLRSDISIPDYCYITPPPPHSSSPLAHAHSLLPPLFSPLLNAWFGPAGTISPLHVDPYHNILTQIVGRKYVRLYAPCESARLYPKGIEDGGVDMGNTSEVDVGVMEGWDVSHRNGEPDDLRKEIPANFPNFKDAKFVDCILEEGECLYIPVGWWHYVRSLSVSFSVSFWWND